MPGRTWSQQDRDEYAAACAEAWDSGDSTRARGEHFGVLVADAVQAHRPWAIDLTRQFALRGAQTELNSWRKSTRPLAALAHDGRVINTTRVIGVQRKDDDGSRYVTQALFDLLTFPEIEDKVTEYRRNEQAYRDNIAVATRLLKLRALAPAAATPADAAQSLGTTVDAWLMQAA